MKDSTGMHRKLKQEIPTKFLRMYVNCMLIAKSALLLLKVFFLHLG